MPTYPVCQEMLMVAEEAERRLPQEGRLLDLGCGVGTIALAVQEMRPDAYIFGVDINEQAVLIANAKARQMSRTEFWVSDVYEHVQSAYHVITCSLPWEDETNYEVMPEPREAFINDDMGLARALSGAKAHLVPDGHFVMWGPANVGKEVFPMVGLEVERYVFDKDENCVVIGRG